MSATLAPHASVPARSIDASDRDPVDLLVVDDRALEEALKAVSWNARDVSHFLRNARATGALALARP
jgi:hypothetical protein